MSSDRVVGTILSLSPFAMSVGWLITDRVSYSFLFMKASGDQLRELGSLIDSCAIRPVVDRVFPFQSTAEALAYVEKGRAKGKVVVNNCEHVFVAS
jgi:NADPH:quinone reductase-like Zn-dependent oxidoreductase